METPDENLRKLISRYLEGTASPAEREMLDRFFDSYKPRDQNPEMSPSDKARGDQILKNIHSRFGERPRSRRAISLWIPLAAAISIFVMAYFFVDTGKHVPEIVNEGPLVMVTDSTVSGMRMKRELPDGSTVHLNSNSGIVYREFGSQREVVLKGEAFFEVVSNGKPFVVVTGDVKTHVLGTSFNVKWREGKDAEITLVKGRVKVRAATGDSMTLRPSERAVFSVQSNRMTKQWVNVERYTSWKDNILLFEDALLEDAIREVEQWYAVKIDILNPAIRHCIITAKYQHEPLGNVLNSFQFLLDLKIKRLGEKHFAIDGKGCK